MPRQSYKVNKLLSGDTRLHLSDPLKLLSRSMKDVFIFIPITSQRFISITCVHSSEPANCTAKHCQWHFKGSQGAFDGILMLSGFFFFVVVFFRGGGISEAGTVSQQL